MSYTKRKSAPAAPEPAITQEPVIKDGVFVYVGPSIRGVIQSGSIYRGTQGQVHEKLAAAIKAFPKIASMIFEDTEVAAARTKIKSGSGALYTAYNALSAAKK
jgi:hypothetical protein